MRCECKTRHDKNKNRKQKTKQETNDKQTKRRRTTTKWNGNQQALYMHICIQYTVYTSIYIHAYICIFKYIYYIHK